MPHRSEPVIQVFSEGCNVTAEQVKKWAAEDGYPGEVRRLPLKTKAVVGAATFVDGEGWHLWEVGIQ